MSAPSSGPPKAATYCIDPRKQCGVVKPSGNPCTALLSCKIHGEDEKRTAKRSKKQQKLLKRQLALDASPFAHHAGQLRLAPVFDANIHCGVDLPAGEPCTQDLLLCETQTCEQQSAVQGRSAGLDDLLRVYRANASRPTWKSGDDPCQYNPDTDCGAMKSNRERCQGLLSCPDHKLKLKHSAPRNPPFQYKFDTLLHVQLSRAAFSETDEPWRPYAAEKGQDGQTYCIPGGGGEGQQAPGGTGNGKMDVQGYGYGPPPATPDQPPRGNVDTASPNHTPTKPSPKTPRVNVTPLSLDTSDDEQFTPTLSRDSFHGYDSGGKYEETAEGSKADLDAQEAHLDTQEAKLAAQEAQLARDWAQLHQDQARGKLHEAKLQICRDWEQACQDQASQHRLEMQLFQDQGRHDRQKAQLYDQDMENRVAAQLLWDRDQEYRRSTQLHYDQDRAELDRRVHERQAIEDEVTRLRTRARHADQLEQARNRQQSEKEFLMHYIKGEKAWLETQETTYQNELMLNDSQTKALQVQIQDLQQSMEVLVLEKTNATARYQLKKVEVEARITSYSTGCWRKPLLCLSRS
jgi:hypothetical protein